MAGFERWDRAVAVAAVCAIQAMFVMWLVAYRAKERGALVVRGDDALVIEYVIRKRDRAPEASPGAVQERRASVETSASRSKAPRRSRVEAMAPVALAETRAPMTSAPLDLSIADDESGAARRFAPPTERGPVIAAAPTRFDRAWRSDGTALDQLKQRSKIAGFALSLFGGPARHCDEVDRRLRKPNCLPEDEDSLGP